MARLSISLLGSFRVTLGGEPVTSFESDKVRALLAYLAVEADRPHRRESLVGLLWPDWPERSARQNLSQTLYRLRAAISDRTADPPFLLITPKTIQFNRQSDCSLDTALLTTLPDEAMAEQLEAAAEAYGGPFLADFSLPDTASFEEWATTTRVDLQQKALDVLGRLAGHRQAAGNLEDAIRYARRAVALDPCSEAAQRGLIHLLGLSGDRGAALAQYQRCVEALWQELGVVPASETQALFQRIQTGELVGAAAMEELPARAPARRVSLPKPLTPFVGRQAELAQIRERLGDADCRLLTLVGPGGSGKTRLAIQAAAARQDDFEHGVYFVPLAPLQSAEAIVPTVAGSLGFSFYSGDRMRARAAVEPQDQLLDYLRRKTLLLVMDSCEHLLAPPEKGKDGAALISEILKNAPDVKILATSRARLNVGGEHRFQVGGMDYPVVVPSTPPGVEDTATYSAVQLFLHCARRALPGFQLTAENVAGVIDVCRLVEGMPLAIRLAGAWVALLSPAEIAVEIGRGLDLLQTDVRNVPDRHRSMRAVLDHSWKTLTGRERALMGELSVFRGGFTRDAAQQVVGTTLPDLMALVNKSLLHRTASGRYEVHELTRAYAAERLGSQPESWEGAHEGHSAFYAAALERWEADLKSARQVAALEEMDQEIENARAAWDWAARCGQADRLGRALEGLCWYYDYRQRYPELRSACKLVAESLADTTTGDELRVLARVLAWQGSAPPGKLDRPPVEQSLALLDRPELHQIDTRRERAFALWRMGALTGSSNLAKGEELYRQSLALYQELGDRWWAALIMWHMGWNSLLAGAQRAAEPWARESLEGFRAVRDPRGSTLALSLLTLLDTFAGRFEQGERWARENLALSRELGDRYYIARALWIRAVVYFLSGQFVEARSLYEKYAAAMDDLGVDDWMVPVTLTDASLHLGHYDYVRAEGERQLAIVGEWGDPQALGEWLLKLAFVAVATRAYGDAQSYLREAVAPLRDAGLLNWLGFTLAMLGVARRGLGEHHLVQPYVLEALQLAARTEYFNLQVTALSAAALSLLDRGRRQLALEVHALASRYPLVANSRWFEDVFGAEIAAVSAALPPEVVAAARERGRARDVGSTIAELLADEGELFGPPPAQ